MNSEVRLHLGVPTVFLDDQPTLLMGVQAATARWPAFRDQGHSVFHVYCTGTWTEAEVIDLRRLDALVEEAHATAPRAGLMLVLDCDAPDWWGQAHPEELHRTEDGQSYRQSMASQLWLHQAAWVITQLVERAQRHPAVFGYFLKGGHTGEWFYRTGPMRYLLDQSAPMQGRFRAWLRDRYGDDERLRRAWADPRASLAAATMPTRREELPGHVGSFRDPARGGRRFSDAYECYARTIAEAFCHFCRVAKRACGGRQICGGNYGHTLDWYANPVTAQHVGHMALSHVLRAPEVDFLSGPNSYQDRGPGGDEYFVAPVASINLHGKVWYAQNDTRTHQSDHLQRRFGLMHTPQQGEAAVRRALGRCVASTTPFFWHDLMGGWFDGPPMQDLLGRGSAIARLAAGRDRSSIAEVALVIDEGGTFHQTLAGAFLADPILSTEPRLADLVQHMGAPCDVLLLEDLLDERTHGYRVYLFANAYAVSEPISQVIRQVLQSDGRTLVWFYASGLVTAGGLSERAMSELTGIELALEDVTSELMVRLDPSSHPLTSDLNDFGDFFQGWVFAGLARHFGTHRPVGPIVYAKDSEAHTLGRYTSTGETALAVKAVNDSTAIFCGVPFAPPVLLRRVCQCAGVHVYLDADDALWVNRSYLGFHAAGPGVRQVRLPFPRHVVETFEGRLVGESVREFSVTTTMASTHLFDLN